MTDTNQFLKIREKAKARLADIENHVGISEGGVSGYYTNLTIGEVQFLITELQRLYDLEKERSSSKKEGDHSGYWALAGPDIGK